jgi:hypothetical protein
MLASLTIYAVAELVSGVAAILNRSAARLGSLFTREAE